MLTLSMRCGILNSNIPFCFQPRAVYALKPLLENVEDLEQLKQLGSAAAEAESLETFLQTLGTQTNSQNGTEAS